MELPSLELFQKSVDVAPGDMIWWVILVVGGQLDLMILEVVSNLNDSISVSNLTIITVCFL